MKRRRKTARWTRRRRRAMIGVALVTLLLVPWLVWRLQLKAEVRENIEALRAAGVPVTAEERQVWLATFPARTPTELYASARNAYVRLPLDYVNDFPTFRPQHDEEGLRARPYPPEVLLAMRTALEVNKVAVEFLHEATALPEGRFLNPDHIFDEPIDLFCAEACVRAADGDGEGALSSITGGLLYLERTAAPYEGAPRWPPHHLERLLVALFSAAGRVELPDDGLRAIHDRLDPSDWEEQERLAGIAWISDAIVQQSDFQLESQVLVLDAVTGFLDRVHVMQVNAWHFSQNQIGKTMAEQEANILHKPEHLRLDQSPVRAPPMILEVARAGINILRFYQATGALPESLAELVPEYCAVVPQDFFSTGPLMYSVEGSSFMIYSVDRDRTDDGGSGKADLVFSADLPPR